MAKPNRQNAGIRVETEPDVEGAVRTEELVKWGALTKRVYIEEVELTKQVTLIDPATGGPMYKRGAGGTVLNAKMKERVKTGEKEVREFILDDLGNGQVMKVYTFREDPKEIERQEKVARRAQFMDEFFEKADAAGGLDKLLETVDG